MSRKLLFAWLAGGVFCLFLVAACGGGGGGWSELLTNGGFETGDLTGWTDAYPLGAAGSVSVLSATVAPLSGLATAGPGEGTFYAVFDQNENFAGVLYQLFTVPDGDDTITLTFDMFVLDMSKAGPVDAGAIAYSGVGNNQHTRVDILSAVANPFDTGGTVIVNLYLDVDGIVPVLPYIPYTFDLSPYLAGGGTYMLRFAQSSNLGYVVTGIDNVSIKSK